MTTPTTPPRRGPGRPPTWDRDAIINAIRRYAAEHGHAPARVDWDRPNAGDYWPSSRTVVRYFDTFDDAIRAANLEPRPRSIDPRPHLAALDARIDRLEEAFKTATGDQREEVRRELFRLAAQIRGVAESTGGGGA